MAGSAILEMLNATPQEQAALRQIAMLRQQGIPDDQIFAGLADPSFTQAGGYGFLPYITDLAGITSSYNLGRGNIALQAAADEYARQGNPYNVVTALQNMRDTGNTAVLTDPTLANVQPGPAGIYQDYLRGLFSDDGAQVAATTGAPASAQNPIAVSNAQQTAAQQQPSAPLDFGAPMAGVTPQQLAAGQNPNYIPAPTNFSFDRPTTQTATQTAMPTNAETGAQSAAARLLSGTINPGQQFQNPFQERLAAGQVPGFSSFNERDFGRLSPDQRASYFGLVGSTGRVSDPMAAYSSYLRQYSQGGNQGARTYR